MVGVDVRIDGCRANGDSFKMLDDDSLFDRKLELTGRKLPP